MKKFLCRLLKQDPSTREGTVVAVSALGILLNVALAGVKIIIGATASSIAILSEGVNNATDSVTALMAIIGAKVSGRHPTEKHPFGFGRIEYLTSLIISVLIIVTGIELIKSSVQRIFHPEEMTVSYVALMIIAISAIAKYLLGSYTLREGKRVDSGALTAVGTENRNDSFISAVTILSALVFLIFHVSIDAYVGVLMALIVLKAGFDVLKDTLSDLLGQAGKKDLADKLYAVIRAEPIVLNAADMMLHNYGPDAYSGSVNIEIDHAKTLGEIYARIHALQLKILREYRITMVFGMYAVDHDHEEMREIRAHIAAFVRDHEHVLSYHALYIDPATQDLYCDLAVDYDLRDWDGLRRDFTDYMAKHCPDHPLRLVIETNYV